MLFVAAFAEQLFRITIKADFVFVACLLAEQGFTVIVTILMQIAQIFGRE